MFLQFVRAVFNHWVAFLTSGVVSAGLALIPELLGHSLPRFVYVLVGVIGGLVVACYRAWRDEHHRADGLAQQLEEQGHRQTRDAEKRELIRLITELQTMEKKLPYWREFAQSRWGTDPEPEKLTPEDPSPILHWAEKIRPGLRTEFESVLDKAQEAERLIRETLNRDVTWRQQDVVRRAYNLLDEAIPILGEVIGAFRSFETKI